MDLTLTLPLLKLPIVNTMMLNLLEANGYLSPLWLSLC